MDDTQVDTYKSIWTYSESTGNYERVQKKKYRFEWFDKRFFRRLPILSAACPLLGRKAQGVDFYRYYEKFLSDGNRGSWQNEFSQVHSELAELGHDLVQKSVLDISGEPGFFGHDAQSVCSEVEVTAFAENVSDAMARFLHLNSTVYDFNTDSLKEKFSTQLFDWVFVRYAIGFCEDLEKFAQETPAVLKPGGHVYITYSPPSRAIFARWMFDDYTYLRLYSLNYMKETFAKQGFEVVADIHLNLYRWDWGMHFIQRLLSRLHTRRIFQGAEPQEFFQSNVLIVFRKTG